MNVSRKAFQVLTAGALATAGIAIAPAAAQADHQQLPCAMPAPAGTIFSKCERLDPDKKSNMEVAAHWDGKTVTVITYANSWRNVGKRKLCSKVVLYNNVHIDIVDTEEQCETLKKKAHTQKIYTQQFSSWQTAAVDYLDIELRRD